MRGLLLSAALLLGLLQFGCDDSRTAALQDLSPNDAVQEAGATFDTEEEHDQSVALTDTHAVPDAPEMEDTAAAPRNDTEPATDSGTTPPPDLRGPSDTRTKPETLRWNEAQMAGTHNSYHVEADFAVHASHHYTHEPLDIQLEEQGVRAFELDLHQHGDTLRVYHLFFIDEESTCDTLKECLGVMKTWSDTHQAHLPIMIWLEIKDDLGGSAMNDLSVIDEAIHAVFSEEQLITPDTLRGTYSSVREALDNEGWPTLDQVRGRFAFILLNGGDHQSSYLGAEPSQSGQVLFCRASADQYDAPWAAFAKINNPKESDAIAAALAAGLMVASNTCGADDSQESCMERREAGLQNGVHMLKDDFPGPSNGQDTWLEIPGGTPARCNPATATPDCTSEALENLSE
jgi:hypothetical protein